MAVGQFLTPDDYVQARSLLGVDIDRLPDGTVELPIYRPAAEADLLARLPDAAERVGAERERVVRAAVYLLAARLVALVAGDLNLTGEQWGDEYRYTLRPVSPDTVAARFRAEADSLLAPLQPPPVAGTFGVFTLAAGRRA